MSSKIVTISAPFESELNVSIFSFRRDTAEGKLFPELSYDNTIRTSDQRYVINLYAYLLFQKQVQFFDLLLLLPSPL